MKCPECQNEIEHWHCDCGADIHTADPVVCTKCGSRFDFLWCEQCWAILRDIRHIPAEQDLYKSEPWVYLRYRPGYFFTDFTFLRFERTWCPAYLKTLESKLVQRTSEGGLSLAPPTNWILSFCDKLGQMKYAHRKCKYSVKEGLLGSIVMSYHVKNAVLACKGCIEALAGILNDVYKLGYSKGQIDLSSQHGRKLLRDARHYNPQLCSRIHKEFQGWIDWLTRYREGIAHKSFVPLLSSLSSTPSRETKTLVPSKPISLDGLGKIQELGDKLEVSSADVFIDNLLYKIEALADLIFKGIVMRL